MKKKKTRINKKKKIEKKKKKIPFFFFQCFLTELSPTKYLPFVGGWGMISLVKLYS